VGFAKDLTFIIRNWWKGCVVLYEEWVAHFEMGHPLLIGRLDEKSLFRVGSNV